MDHAMTFDTHVARHFDALSPAEMRVARYFQANREQVLFASASDLAANIGTSDATVIRTTKALGFDGLHALRRQLADEMRGSLTPAARMARTLDDVGGDPRSALATTLDIHVKAIEALRSDISDGLFQSAIDRFCAATRVKIFGIGPSSAIATYFAVQLSRIGIEAAGLTQTGLLLADELQHLRKGELVVVLAYGRVYREVDVLLTHAHRVGASTVLLSDTLGAKLSHRVDLVLPVARGRTDQLSMHTATLALIESLLVGVAVARPVETVANLKLLNELRSEIAGPAMQLPQPIRVKPKGPAR